VWLAIFAGPLVFFYRQKPHSNHLKKRHVFVAFSFKAMENTGERA